MMLKLGALSAGVAIMVRCGDGIKNFLLMLSTGKMLFYISVNFCQRQKIKGRLAPYPGGFVGQSRTSQPDSPDKDSLIWDTLQRIRIWHFQHFLGKCQFSNLKRSSPKLGASPKSGSRSGPIGLL
jgi:hypothetical protein